MGQVDVVTGAFGYTGSRISTRLLAAGHRVRTLTNHPGPASDIEVHPYQFHDRDAMIAAMTGATVLYNTYWVRYAPGGTTYAAAVANTRRMIEAAVAAGVRRMVHVSITNPSHDSFYEYYRGKAAIEDLVRGSGLSYAIVRPTVIFGAGDILVNNIAWLVRRFHLFAIPGDGRYRVRPVSVEDLADLCVRLGADLPDADLPDADRRGVVVDAVGPETFTFEDLVRTIAAGVGARCLPVHLPPVVVVGILRLLALVTRDVVLTGDEIRGLTAELVSVDGPATCPTRLTDHLAAHPGTIGANYHSELARRR